MAAKDSPLKQFEIVPFSKTELGGYDISFTNSSLSMKKSNKSNGPSNCGNLILYMSSCIDDLLLCAEDIACEITHNFEST